MVEKVCKMNTHNEVLQGTYIDLYEVELEDSEFILNLRVDSEKSKYLHKTEYDLGKQIDYIKKYKKLENEWYFIIKSKSGESLGTFRINDLREDSFSIASWIVKDDAPVMTSLESILLIYNFGFNKLNFNHSHFDVRKENKKVISLHKKLGAKIVNENSLDVFFIIKKEDFEVKKKKYEEILNNG